MGRGVRPMGLTPHGPTHGARQYRSPRACRAGPRPDPCPRPRGLRPARRDPRRRPGALHARPALRGPRGRGAVWQRLWANGPDDCRPRRIRVQVEAPATLGAERVSCTALEVRLAAPVPPGGSGAISLRFEVRVRRVADRFGIVRGTVLLGNVIPVLAVRDQRGLHLEPYARRGESFYSP